jgi:hypothetical protein
VISSWSQAAQCTTLPMCSQILSGVMGLQTLTRQCHNDELLSCTKYCEPTYQRKRKCYMSTPSTFFHLLNNPFGWNISVVFLILRNYSPRTTTLESSHLSLIRFPSCYAAFTAGDSSKSSTSSSPSPSFSLSSSGT